MSHAELLGVVGIGNETRNVRRHLDPLLKLSLIERTNPERLRSRLQRYRITDSGRALLDEMEESSE